MTPGPLPVIWQVVHRKRLALANDLEMLAPGHWETPSLCPGWSVHDVLAHLVDTARTTRLGFVRRMFAAGFDFDKVSAVGLAGERCADPQQTLAGDRRVLTRTSTPPAALPTRLMEAFVHGEDIRRPLGIRSDYPAAHVATALEYQVRTSTKIGGGKELAAGFRLVASDTRFEHGTGEMVSGPVPSLLPAVSGRPLGVGELSGPGAGAFVKHNAS
ncbi:hypothetical protein DQ353_17795 [Arthrobacter sp. AQ5-05]|uniref:maleylpyruvate isomerase family mycothiol-dependent enzyme n=1 Tax=Arthrobacter sp. AQ5-05 TaxID=2184581 RepID=UPI000DCC6ED8|nr:maleylpyruvate isomerase family mycothiol-dependent enzyme [Arthrobacter sp. AQ5-05]RAX47962.1 hypothetical protein DQ353_17795 [Arthrobacter sp. AQ5-05]